MKVNLLLDNPGGVRSGYLNIDPAAPPDDPHGRSACPIDRLEQLLDAGEVTELVAHDILDVFPSSRVGPVLEGWMSRLAHGGRLHLSVVDVREVCRGYLSGGITLGDVQELLHGQQTSPYKVRLSAHHAGVVRDFFDKRGWTIVRAAIENWRAVVTVART